MKTYSNCELFNIISKYLYLNIVQLIYVFYLENNYVDKYSFCEYLYFLYVFYVEDLDIFYNNSPQLTLWEELRLIDALDELFYWF